MTGVIGSVNLLISSQFTRIGTLRFRRKKKRSCNSAQNNDLVQLKAFLDIHHCSFRHWDSGADFDAVEVKPSSFQGLSFPSLCHWRRERSFLNSWLMKEKERNCNSSLRPLLLPSRLVNRDHKILRRGLLRGRDFLNSWCAGAWTTAFWREILVAVFIFLWVSAKCRGGGSNLSTARSIIILRLVENWSFFTKNIRGNFFGENVWWSFPGCICFEHADKKV